jgi:hypothetical protein
MMGYRMQYMREDKKNKTNLEKVEMGIVSSIQLFEAL